VARLILTNANLLDGEHPAKPGATVVVDGDRIASVTVGPVEAAPDDRIVDLAGRTLMPGMATCHFHATYHELGSFPAPYGLEEVPALQAVRAAKHLEDALARGFTGVVSAGVPHGIDAAMKQAIARGVINGPRFVPSGRELSTTGHGNDNAPWHWDVRAAGAARCCDGPEEFRRATRDEVKRGAEMIKVFLTGGHGTTAPKDRVELAPDELRAIVDTAHSRGARVRAHVANKPGILMALDAGVDVLDHCDDLDDECIERIVAAGAFVAPSIYFPTAFLAAMGSPGLGFTDAMKADIDHMCQVLPKADAAGVKLVLGDDYGAVGFAHGRYAEELGVYVRDAGIPALEVLRWATKHGGELVDPSGGLGVVAEAKLADLLVVDGDPSVDVTVLEDRARVLAVLKAGVFVAGNAPDGASPPAA
jgi:imidazolonepropionase-like amidohydrolase